MHVNNSIKDRKGRCKYTAINFFTVLIMVNDIRSAHDRLQSYIAIPDQPLRRKKQRSMASKSVEKIKGNKKYLRQTRCKQQMGHKNL